MIGLRMCFAHRNQIKTGQQKLSYRKFYVTLFATLLMKFTNYVILTSKVGLVLNVQGVVAAFSSPDTVRFLDTPDENLSIANLPRIGCL